MKNNKGLTLVELLITLTILAVVMTLTATILVQAFNIFNNSTERVSNNRLAQIMVEDITQNIREYSYFDFKSNNKWEFNPDKTNKFIIEYDKTNKKLILKKSGNEFRKLEGVESFKLISYSSNRIIYYNEDGKNKEIEFENGQTILFKENDIIFKDNIEIVILNETNKNFENGTELEIIDGGKIEFKNGDQIKFDELIKIKFDDGTEIDLNSFAFEFEIEVDTGNNIITEIRTVYPRNFNFWR